MDCKIAKAVCSALINVELIQVEEKNIHYS